MKKMRLEFVFFLLTLTAATQEKKVNIESEQTLLWKISGNGLTKPSYLFGTIHLLCADDAVLSNNMKNAIRDCDKVYLELDMDDIFEMMSALPKMKMRNDTTLSDLLSKEDYQKVKNYFADNQALLPFSLLESFKPIFTVSTLSKNEFPCEDAVAMEQIIMQQAHQNGKEIKGLELMSDQLEIFDKIPYKLQAALLLQFIDSALTGKNNIEEYNELLSAYKQQDLVKLEELIKRYEIGLTNFIDILLYDRNKNWVEKLKIILPGQSLVIAVGAGHLPGEQGVINLLRKAGFTVTPVENKMTTVKEI